MEKKSKEQILSDCIKEVEIEMNHEHNSKFNIMVAEKYHQAMLKEIVEEIDVNIAECKSYPTFSHSVLLSSRHNTYVNVKNMIESRNK